MKQVSRRVPIENILADDQARRVSASKESLDALKNSIAAIGLLDPIIVEALPGDKYRLSAGRNRYTAIKALREEGNTQFDEVSCTVLEFDSHELLDENYKNYKVSQVIFDSNDKRSQLTKFEQARHYSAQKRQFPHLFKDDEELARFNNKPANEVVEALRLLSIDQTVVDRVEQLNLQQPNTIPFMCLEAIALAASDKKRPLPVEGQMQVIERLMSPDVNDKLAVMALVTRDKMKKLVDEIRKEYVPDPRGRKPKQEAAATQETSNANGTLPYDTAESEPNNDEVSEPDGNNQKTTETPVDVKVHAKGNVHHEDHEADRLDQTAERPLPQSLEISVDKETAKPATVSISHTISPPSASTLSLVNINITTVINVLHKDQPTITEEEYNTLVARLEEIRLLLRAAVL